MPFASIAYERYYHNCGIRGGQSWYAGPSTVFARAAPQKQAAASLEEFGFYVSRTMNDSELVIDGLVETPVRIAYADLAAMPAADQVVDVSRFVKGRAGEAVTLESLLKLARPLPEADHVTLHASRDDFHVSVPLADLAPVGLLVYRLDGAPLAAKAGGPYRLVLKNYTACHTSELDDCANVKFLDRIELSHHKGRDTRPTTAEEHAALHAREHG